MKFAVIGLDGASFELIDPWIKEGILPNIGHIKQYGVYSDMESVLPPVTAPNWKCFSTGNNPGDLGIFWWENIDWENNRIYFPHDRLNHPEIWDYLSAIGFNVGIIGMPTTFPPKNVNGFLIAGGFETPDCGFANPPTIENELSEMGWKNKPDTFMEVDQSTAISELLEIMDTQFSIANKLVTKYDPDFFMFTCFHINILQHFLWDSDYTKQAWQLIDKYLGGFIDIDCPFIIMSDHGSNKINCVFNINTWLMQEGYSVWNHSISDVLSHLSKIGF